MKLFAHHHHNSDRPWDDAPPHALELRKMLLEIRGFLKETIMPALANLQAAEANLETVATASGELTLVYLVVTSAYRCDIHQQNAIPGGGTRRS